MNSNEIYEKARSNGVSFECDCISINIRKWEKLMKNHTKANKKNITSIIKQNYDNFNYLFLGYNPYNFYKTKTHLIVVHSSIEYFFKIN